jgi:hypothetical protein
MLPTRAAGAESKNFCLKVRASFFNLPLRKLKKQIFASCCTQRSQRRVAGFQGVLSPLVRFLGSFFLGRERMNIFTGTAQREAVCASVEKVAKT